MKIQFVSVLVDDQAKALAFYTDVLGFTPQQNIPMGEAAWLTVSGDGGEWPQISLEPDAHPAAGPFKRALVDDGIPFTSFGVDDVQAEFERLSAAGVVFTQPPTAMGPVTTAIFDDNCGNLIQIASVPED
jgi:catechol 2,3-dioxygenase-like lactoylglutathione lyase family enzyme